MELFNVYSLYPVEPVRGKSCFVYDAAGTEYLDLYGGHAVISIGHAQPDYVRALSEQAARLGFYSNSVENSLQTTLAEKLGRASGYDDYSLFLCNSGAEANENALKLASFHTGRTKVLAFSKAFHGRTSGAVAATDNPAISAPFNRTANVEFVPLNDIGAARAKLATGEFAAVIIEGIQGVAGIHCPADDFLRDISFRLVSDHVVREVLRPFRQVLFDRIHQFVKVVACLCGNRDNVSEIVETAVLRNLQEKLFLRDEVNLGKDEDDRHLPVLQKGEDVSVAGSDRIVDGAEEDDEIDFF